jgi:hypothetical protein
VGLNQFAEFLTGYLAGDAEAREVYQRHGANFMLTCHRNFYMFALVDASQQGRRIDPNVSDRFEASLASNAPSFAGALRRSVAVATVALLNASPFRFVVPMLWRVYGILKGGSQ